MTKNEYKQWESSQLLIAFVGFVLLLVIYTAVKVTLAHFALPVQPVEPFKYQAGYWSNTKRGTGKYEM